MSDENKTEKAASMYKTLCDALDEKEMHYDKKPDDLVVTFVLSGEDIPMTVVAAIDADRQLVRVFSALPFCFAEDKRLEGAIATCQANYCLADGNFDYNYNDGRVIFRLTSCYRDSLISKELFWYMIACLGYTVDKYNDKFLLISKGSLSIDEFVKSL